jgi:hypothetical protein
MLHPGQSPQAEQFQVMKRESSGKGATLGDLFKDKLAGLASAGEAASASEAEAAEGAAAASAGETEAAVPSAPAGETGAEPSPEAGSDE